MSRLRTSSWVRLGDGSPARLGLKVFDQADPRHVGELIAIEHSAFAVIRWDDTGWKSVDIRLGDLHRAYCLCGAARPGEWTAGVHHGVHRCARVITKGHA